MNVQHLESLYEMVERFTGVKVKERVPDYVLAQAHQVVNVDLPAEDLQERMRTGKIYPTERIERALSNFFTEPNLNQLREIALEQVAHVLDRRRQERDRDALMARTAGRPLPSGRISHAQGLAFAMVATAAGAVVLTIRSRSKKVKARNGKAKKSGRRR